MQGINCPWACSDSLLLPFGRADCMGMGLTGVITVFHAVVLWTSEQITYSVIMPLQAFFLINNGRQRSSSLGNFDFELFCLWLLYLTLLLGYYRHCISFASSFALFPLHLENISVIYFKEFNTENHLIYLYPISNYYGENMNWSKNSLSNLHVLCSRNV